MHINGAQGSAGYNPRVNNIVRGFEIKGPLDKDLLQQALDKVVNSHAILKSAFRQRNDSNYYCRTSQGKIASNILDIKVIMNLILRTMFFIINF